MGTVIEVTSGDTLMILPNGETYDAESKLKKISLASLRAPRAGNERTGKPDEPYSAECKERLRAMTIGKSVKVNVNYEREIPMGPVSVKQMRSRCLCLSSC
jgi:staphylococcal nuclease domain-containing protein 1